MRPLHEMLWMTFCNFIIAVGNEVIDHGHISTLQLTVKNENRVSNTRRTMKNAFKMLSLRQTIGENFGPSAGDMRVVGWRWN